MILQIAYYTCPMLHVGKVILQVAYYLYPILQVGKVILQVKDLCPILQVGKAIIADNICPVFQVANDLCPLLQVADDIANSWNTMLNEQHVPLSQYMSMLALKAVLQALFVNIMKDDKDVLEFKRKYDQVRWIDILK